MDKEITNYQQALEELQEIVTDIEANTIGIDDLPERMKRAAQLIEFCQRKLRTTTTEMEQLFGPA